LYDAPRAVPGIRIAKLRRVKAQDGEDGEGSSADRGSSSPSTWLESGQVPSFSSRSVMTRPSYVS
jgi:hypothetical protein